ncbi:DNA repair protein Rad50 [Lepidopterella palustris CBS 459.81]|uniref:DNA repair protein RAD50 n=1 Tax=Lepidopterella palustris CBS 459.81 TaxID=1314670 RepID=A0A8E2JA63_9PEZI|nr:DNA repair protein Rad50 [Lepidopterella palustris CBS 459.81]
MSKIDKLSILGIRSFDNTRSETIQFQAPLTLIVGFNGSGKTTIIECLKYATTGELPPNSKGGAFIHDPKLCGENEVLAQVKLSFKSTSQAKMVATRSMQLTVKKASRTFKTLEGQLLMVKDGERTAISSRVAELDQIMPQYLGVSKAILESVIFCHQDESLWPMSEPGQLKKRFDEIFEALKYTKAIDNIKVLRKKQNEELAKYRIIEQNAKEDKDRGDRAEKRATELHDEIERLRLQSSSLHARVEDAAQKSQEAWNHAAQFEQIVARLEGKRIERRTLEKNVEDLRDNLQEMQDSDDGLKAILAQYEERIAQQVEERESNRVRYSELSKELEDGRRSLGIKQGEVGKFEAQKDQYERQVQHRENLVKETARRHGIHGFSLEITDEHVRDFMEKIAKMSRDQNQAFEKARRETQEELKKAQSALNLLNERKSVLNQSRETSRAQIATNDRRIAIFQTELDKIAFDEGGKAALESAMEDTGRRLNKAKADLSAANWDQRIQELDSQIRALDDVKEKLDTELIEGTRQAADSAQLDYLRKELRDKEHSLQTLIGAHKDRIAQVLGSSWDPNSLEQDFQSALTQRMTEVKEVEMQRDAMRHELEQVEFKLSTNQAQLKKKQEQLAKCEKEVSQALYDEEEIEDFESILREREEAYQTESSDGSKFAAQLDYFKKCLANAKEDNMCRLCERHLKDEKNFTKTGFIKKLETVVEKALNAVASGTLDDLASDLGRARNARPSYDMLVRLRDDEIPSLESEAESLRSRHQTLTATVQEQDDILRDRQDAKREVESHSKTIQNITKYQSDILNLEHQIKELALKQSTAGMSRGLEKIQDHLRAVNEESRSTKSTLAQLSTDRDRARNHINALEFEAKDLESNLHKAEYQLKEKASLLARIEELKSHNSEQRETMRRLDKDIQDVMPQIEQAQLKYDDANRRGTERDNELQQQASKLSDSVRQLQHADQEIKAYIDRGGPEQLARTQMEIEHLEAEVSRLEATQRQITVQIKKIDDQLRNTDNTKRAINDNLRFRRSSRELEEVLADIEHLESQNAESDKAHYEREGHKWQLERNKLSAEEASLIGSLKSKDDQLQDYLRDWETDYKDAAYKYKEAHIRVETTKAAVEDLGRYGSALDKAIMKFHSIKMEEINRIIEELWKKTYQGTDVDSILIRSDNETVKGNKSYNYRVVMVKQDAEMDMRGRCSAGQKVLASIIIRLALAECFGVNCGLIALDEPTTNLDQDNIRALAESLAEIIKVRRQQTNFQLIVITHDEEFLRYMQCADFCDTYYRVSRNERQKSIIERQSIAEVV